MKEKIQELEQQVRELELQLNIVEEENKMWQLLYNASMNVHSDEQQLVK
jgi:hypothetical protein